MIKPLVFLVSLLIAVAAFGQHPSEPVKPMPVGDLLLTLPSSHIPAEGTWEWKFMHRFNQSIDEGEAIHSLFGLDSGANVVIGVSYVLTPRIQFSLTRSNVLDAFEASGKYVVFQQARSVPVTATLRGGAVMRTDRDLEDRNSFFAQAIVSREIGGRFGIYAVPTFVTDAGRGVSGDSSEALFQHAFNVPVGLAWMFRPGLSLVAEIIPPNGDLPDDIDSDLGWAIGIKRALGGHYFEVLLTNSNATSVDQYVTGTYQGGGLRSGDIQLGFNIERRFGRRR